MPMNCHWRRLARRSPQRGLFVNGIAAGPFLIVMMLISRDRKIMGAYRNGRLAATLGWTTTAIMCLAGAYGIWDTLTGG